MGQPKKRQRDALAKARQAKKQKKAGSPIYVSSSGDSDVETFENPQSYNPEIDCTSWAGGINHELSSDSDWVDGSDDESDDDLSELEGDALRESLCLTLQHEIELLREATPYEKINKQKLTRQDWKKIESCRSLGYDGASGRSKRRKEKLARDKAKTDAQLRKR
jgi:hypothetical protein